MDCEAKDKCANYNGECTNDDFCLCEDFEETSEESKLYNTLYKTIDKLREFNQADLIKQVEEHEKREDELREQIAELKKQLPNVDKLRKECLQEVRNEVFGPFTIGQEVFIVASESNRHPCSECNGNKKVKCILSTGEAEAQCPKCKGYGFIDTHTYHPKKATVNSLTLHLYENRDTWKTENKVEIYLRGYDYSKQAKELFLTAEECQADIDSWEKK